MAGAETLTFSDADFDQDVLQSEMPVLVDFWADWCPPCKMLGPVIDNLATVYRDKVRVGKLDIATNPQSAARFGVSLLPTVIIFQNGEIKDQLVGFRSEQDFKSALDKLIVK